MSALEFYAEYRDYCREWYKKNGIESGYPKSYGMWLADTKRSEEPKEEQE
jgi:hypothetical protein